MTDRELDAVAEVIGKFMGGFLTYSVIFAAVSAAVMLAWNAAVPDVFGLPSLAYKQAAAFAAIVASLSYLWKR